MDRSKIRMKTNEFRAISNADIVIDGITVVAGENGCGKSTLSKLLFHFYKSATSYEENISDEVRRKLLQIIRFLEVTLSELNRISEDEKYSKDEFSAFRETVHRKFVLSEVFRERYINLVDRVVNSFNTNLSFKKERVSSKISHRFEMIVGDILGDKYSKETFYPIPLQALIDKVNEIFDNGFEQLSERPTSKIIEDFDYIFNDELPEVLEIYEHGDLLMQLNGRNVGLPFEVQNVVYIDTPMMLNVESSNNVHWDILTRQLEKKSSKGKLKSNLSTLISKEIINGEADNNEDEFLQNSFSFTRGDSVYDLLDCATGIKAFSIIQLLLDNGSLTNKTLLIIDEPESNLHPQWIIEYARLIVLLNKEIGIKFFIASHNPDMVSALKHIAKNEGNDETLYFYLAKKKSQLYQYDYGFLDKNIDPIFESFNIALDRINQYSSK